MLRKTMIVLAMAAALTGGLTADALARGPAASLEHIGGRRRGAARKDAAGCHCRAGRSDAKEIPSRCRHGFRHSLSPSNGSRGSRCRNFPARSGDPCRREHRPSHCRR